MKNSLLLPHAPRVISSHTRGKSPRNKSPRNMVSPRAGGTQSVSPRNVSIPLAQVWINRTQLGKKERPVMHLKRITDDVARAMRTGVSHCIGFRLRLGRDVHSKLAPPKKDTLLWFPMHSVRDAITLEHVSTTSNTYAGLLLDEAFRDVVVMLVRQGMQWFLSRQVMFNDNPFFTGAETISSIVNLVIYWNPETLSDASSGELYKYWITLTLPVPDEERLSMWYKRCHAAMNAGQIRSILCCIHLGQDYNIDTSALITEFSISGAYDYMTCSALCHTQAVHWTMNSKFKPIMDWFKINHIGVRLGFLPRENTVIDATTRDFDTSTIYEWAYIIAIWDNQTLCATI